MVVDFLITRKLIYLFIYFKSDCLGIEIKKEPVTFM